MSRISIDGGVAGPTYAVDSTNTAACPFAAIKLTDANGRKIKGALMECDIYTGNAVRYCLGGTSSDQYFGHRLAPGAAVPIEGYANCASVLINSDVDGSAGKLYITPYY